MMKWILIPLLLIALVSSKEVRVLRGHLGQTIEEAEITYDCTVILMDVVYSMLNKCWNICPYLSVSTNVDTCMNSCVLKNAKRKGRKYASEEEIQSYLKQCPSITLVARNTFLRNKDIITVGGRLPNVKYWKNRFGYYVHLTHELVRNMQITCI